MNFLNLRKISFYSFYKTCYIKKMALRKNVKTLILGSSHGDYAWIPDKDEFNFCLASQDLYYSYQLYHKYVKFLPNLKKIILFFSVFSPGFELDKCPEKERCMVYDALFNIPPKTCFYETNPYKNILLRVFTWFKFQKIILFFRNYRGKCLDLEGKAVLRQDTANLEDRVQNALKHNKRNQTGFDYIKKLIAETNEYKQELIIILSPVHSKYKEIVDKAIHFNCESPLLESAKFKVIDGYRLGCLSDDCFWDFDHLRPEGAKQFTAAVRKEININDFIS